jgi:hypothetical protein
MTASADSLMTERIGSPSAGCRKSAILKNRWVFIVDPGWVCGEAQVAGQGVLLLRSEQKRQIGRGGTKVNAIHGIVNPMGSFQEFLPAWLRSHGVWEAGERFSEAIQRSGGTPDSELMVICRSR